MKEYLNAYKPWSVDDDALLKEMVLQDISVKQISGLLSRNPGAILSRIRQKQLKPKYTLEVDQIKFEITLHFIWLPVMQSKLGLYRFPQPITSYMIKKYQRPAVYRWIVRKGSNIIKQYIGETKQLCPNRMNGYLNPENSMTNRRLFTEFHEQIKMGNEVLIDELSPKISNIYDFLHIRFTKDILRKWFEEITIDNYRNSTIILLNK